MKKAHANYIIFIGDAIIKKKSVCVFRDNYGKFYVKVDGITTQKRLTSNEIIMYLLSAVERED